MKEALFPHSCDEANAPLFALWIRERGGVAVWKSQDLGDPSASWSTPVRQANSDPVQRPSWKAGAAPDSIHTDPDRIGVYTSEKYGELSVTLKGNGLSLYLTDTSQRKVDRMLDRCRKEHGDAWYRRGGLEFPSMEVRYTADIVSLTEWLKLHPRAGLPVIDHDYLPNVGLIGLTYGS